MTCEEKEKAAAEAERLERLVAFAMSLERVGPTWPAWLDRDAVFLAYAKALGIPDTLLRKAEPAPTSAPRAQ